MKFDLIHRIPGRARFRAERSFGLRTANTLADGLYGIEGIEGVRVNPRVGSVLLLYSNEAVLAAASPNATCPRLSSPRPTTAAPAFSPSSITFSCGPYCPLP